MISTADNSHHFDRAQDDKRTTPHIARAERKRRPLNSTAARRDRRRASFDLATRWPGRHGTVLQAEKRKAKAELVAEIMREHGVSERTAYRWIAEGRTGPRVRQQDAKPWVAAGCSESTWRRHGKPDSWRKIVKTAKTGVRRNKPNPLKVLGSCEVTENWQNAVTSKLSGKSLIPLSVTLAARAERATPPRIRARPIRRRGRPRKALLRHRRIFSTAAAETVGVCGTKGPGRHAAPRWKVVIGFVPTVRISAEGQAR